MNIRGSAAGAAFALSLLLILSCAPASAAQDAGGERAFRGWVGKYPVRMTLRRGADGEVSGSYSYEGRAGSLALKGTVDARGRLRLEEYDGAKRTGTFEGHWREREYEPEAMLDGEWKRPGGGGQQFFNLSEELGGSPRVTSKRIQEENKRRGYTVEAAYPQVAGAEAFNRLVEGFITKEVAEFKKEAGFAPGEKRQPGIPGDSLTVNYNMRLTTDELLSVEFTLSYYEHGAAHPSHALSVINYDLGSGRKLELSDLFRPGANYLPKLSSLTVERLRKWGSDPAADAGQEESAGLTLPEEDIREGASPKTENYRNWTLTRRGLVVSFDPYQVGPYAAGSPAVLIPYAELKALARPGGPLAGLSK